jgi:hypothetical protein
MRESLFEIAGGRRYVRTVCYESQAKASRPLGQTPADDWANWQNKRTGVSRNHSFVLTLKLYFLIFRTQGYVLSQSYVL